MSLIHYYKFNNNLYDSIGAFDLIADVGTPVYTTGILGGSSGAITSGSVSMYYFGCVGNGGAVNGFMAENASEAANGVSNWSVSGWVYCSGNTTQIINLLSSTAGQSGAYLYYDQKYGGLTFAGLTRTCSINSWVFFTIRQSLNTYYFSVNAGTEVSGFWSTGSGTGGNTQFNGIRIGSPALYYYLYARVDDLRCFNHSLSSGEINGIYNAGLPSEAAARVSNYKSTYRHFKFNSSLNDINVNSPSIAATIPIGSYSYTSGIATNTNNSIRILSAGTQNGMIDAGGLPNFYISYLQTVNHSFGYSWWMSNSSGVYYRFDISGTCDFEAALSNWKITSSLGIINIADNDPYCLHKSFFYDGIARRFLYYQNSLLKYQHAGTIAGITTGFRAYTSGSIGSAFLLDDVRFYGGMQAGLEVLDIYNSGNGTEINCQGEASGSGATVTMTVLAGTASVLANGVATGTGATVTMATPTGSAFTPTNATATGTGGTVTVSTFTGSAGSPGSASGSLPTITVSTFSGSSTAGSIGSGSLSTIVISSFTGIAFPEFIATGSLPSVTASTLIGVASNTTSIQLSYCSCDTEIGWKQVLPITGFSSVTQGEDAVSARVTPIVSGIDANIVFFERRTITASSSYTYNLQTLTDFLGQSFALSKVYGVSVIMESGSAIMSPGLSNPLKWFFNSNTANVTITSGKSFMFAQKSSAIVSNSAKTILMTNPSGLSACVYKIAILGGR